MTVIEFSLNHESEIIQADVSSQENCYSVKLPSGEFEFSLEVLEQTASTMKGTAHCLTAENSKTYPFVAAWLPKQDDAQPIQIWLNGETFILNQQLPQKKSRQGQHAHGVSKQLGAVKAPMPGTILKVLVKEGDKLTAHQPVIIMESMKMEMTLSAPDVCAVGKIAVSPNQLVAMHEILVELKPVD